MTNERPSFEERPRWCIATFLAPSCGAVTPRQFFVLRNKSSHGYFRTGKESFDDLLPNSVTSLLVFSYHIVNA